MLKGVLQLSLHAARKSRLAVWKLWHQAHDHVCLIDQLEITHVDLAVNIARDIKDFAHGYAHGRAAGASAETMRFNINEILTSARRLDCPVKQQLLIDITRIKGDKVLRKCVAEVIDFCKYIRHVHDMTHREAWIHLLHLRPSNQPQRSFHGVALATAAQDVEILSASKCLRHQFSGQDFFFTPHHAILQRGINVMLLVEPVVDHLNVVDQADKHIWLQHLQLIKVKRTEETMPPTERGMRIDDQVGMLRCRRCCGNHILEHRAAQVGQA